MLLTTRQSKIWKEENLCEEENAGSNIQRNSEGIRIISDVIWLLVIVKPKSPKLDFIFPVQGSNGYFKNSETKPLCVAQ